MLYPLSYEGGGIDKGTNVAARVESSTQQENADYPPS